MSLKKIIDLDLLGRFLDKVKDLIPTKVSELENDARYMSGMTILSYGKSTWADFMEAYGDNKVVYCRASSGSNPASGSQTRMAFMAYVNNQTTPTEVEFQYYRSVNAHTDAQQGDQVYVYKLNKTNGWSVTVRNSFSKLVTGTGLTHTYSNGTITIANSEIVPGVVSTAADGLAPQLPDESTTTKFLRQDATWAVPEYPVTSVNGSIGAVTVDVPSKMSDLQNDSGFITGITSADVTTALGYTPPTQDTTYESKAAVSGGTDVSLVTTGEKYTWNNKGTYSKPSGGIPDSDIASAATWNAKGNGTITGIKMNGASKGTSGVVDLGTVITAHQDISGKADKSATVSNIAYDSTNKKLTKTINGTTSDVVTAATLKTAMALDNVENKSSATIRGELTKANVTTALGYTPPTTDTTYESKSAASGGTDVSLVTTGEKYIWNTKELPSVTSSDNDKVLKVVDGAWSAGENEGGGLLVVNTTGNPWVDLYGGALVNCTYQDIRDAYDSGKDIILTTTLYHIYTLSGVTNTRFTFTHISTGSRISTYELYVDSSSPGYAQRGSSADADQTPTGLKPHVFIEVSLDESETPPAYKVDYSEVSDISELLNNYNTMVCSLIFNKSMYEAGTTNGIMEEYQLSNWYTTMQVYDPVEDYYRDVGHLFFTNVSVSNGEVVLKQFEISQFIGQYDSLSGATVTYTEPSLGQAPSASGVSF